MLPPDMKHFTGHNSYSHIKAMNGDVTSGIDDQHNKEDKHFKNNQKHASLTGNKLMILLDSFICRKRKAILRALKRAKTAVNKIEKKIVRFVRKPFFFKYGEGKVLLLFHIGCVIEGRLGIRTFPQNIVSPLQLEIATDDSTSVLKPFISPFPDTLSKDLPPSRVFYLLVSREKKTLSFSFSFLL